VAYTCNPSYSGGRDQEVQDSKPAWGNSSEDSIQNKTNNNNNNKKKPQSYKKKERKSFLGESFLILPPPFLFILCVLGFFQDWVS
jgi:hypothetical protein